MQHRTQPLQPVSIKRVISLLRIQFVKACSVLADLSDVESLVSKNNCGLKLRETYKFLK